MDRSWSFPPDHSFFSLSWVVEDSRSRSRTALPASSYDSNQLGKFRSHIETSLFKRPSFKVRSEDASTSSERNHVAKRSETFHTGGFVSAIQDRSPGFPGKAT